VVIENGSRYGCVKSALLWYKCLGTTIKDMGFKLNPYDLCVANCEIEESQCTIAWYVVNMKILHVNPEVVTRILLKLEEQFGKMTIPQGKKHVFLGHAYYLYRTKNGNNYNDELFRGSY
jgi:hypothetical protein